MCESLVMKKTLAGVLALSTAALLFAGCGDKAKTGSTTKQSWLFSLQSAGTTGFDRSSRVLSMPVGNLVGFTDRPNRVERRLTPTQFGALWSRRSDDSFSVDPPNASLTYWDSDVSNAIAHTVIVEITKDVSRAGKVLSLTLHILSPSGAVLPTKMYRASLFIDNKGFNQNNYAGWNTPACESALNAYYDAQNEDSLAGDEAIPALNNAVNDNCPQENELN
jgi:hypothetical protein